MGITGRRLGIVGKVWGPGGGSEVEWGTLRAERSVLQARWGGLVKEVGWLLRGSTGRAFSAADKERVLPEE